jgi:hypothetical protein
LATSQRRKSGLIVAFGDTGKMSERLRAIPTRDIGPPGPRSDLTES